MDSGDRLRLKRFLEGASLNVKSRTQTSGGSSIMKETKEVQVEKVDGDFATGSVHDSARRPLYEITLNMAGGPICVAALFAGASLTKGLSLVESALAVISGGLILAIYGGIIGAVGMRTGLSTGMLLKRTFGEQGSKVISVLLALCLVGWYGVQTGFFGDTIHMLYPQGGWLTSSHSAAAWGGVLMLLTALWGYRGLSILSLVAVPLLFVLSIWGLLTAISLSNISAYVPASRETLGNGITLVVGALAVGATTTADITRYAKSSGHSWFSCFFAYLVTNSFMLLSGAITAIATGSGDLLAAMLALGLGVPALLILVLGQWTTNDDNLYSSSLAITASMPSLKKPYVVVALGLVATLSAVVGVANLFVPFLLFLGVAIPPIGGVLIADFIVVKGTAAERLVTRNYSVRAFLAWCAGATAGYLVPIGIPAVNSIVLAFIAYLILSRCFGHVSKGVISDDSAISST